MFCFFSMTHRLYGSVLLSFQIFEVFPNIFLLLNFNLISLCSENMVYSVWFLLNLRFVSMVSMVSFLYFFSPIYVFIFKVVSCMAAYNESCFCIQFDNLYIVIGSFRPFTFHVIFYLYGFKSTILLFVFYLHHMLFIYL